MNPTHNSLSPAPARILIVDDEPDIRAAVGRLLDLEGYQTAQASSAFEALGLLEREPYQGLILDLRMPEVNGLTLMENVHRIDPDLPVIILTGYGTLESAMVASRTEAVVDYLLKPARNEEIVAAVDRAVHKWSEQTRHQQLLEAAGQILDAVSPLKLVSATSVSPTSTANQKSKCIVSVPPLSLDRKQRLVTIRRNGSSKCLDLTKGETAVLTALMNRPGQVLSCEALVSEAFNYEVDEFEAKSIIRPYIWRLRQKVESNPTEPLLISTVRRRGYRFNPDPSR